MNEAKTLEVLTTEECIHLITDYRPRVGRLAIAGPRPVILPVNYVVDKGEVVFRTAPGTKLHAAVKAEFVAFEVDDVMPEWRSGWSVLVRGQSHEVRDPAETERLSKLPLQSWAAGEKEHFVRISNAIVSGRRLVDHS
jgi:uncharacterized protein